MPRPEIDTHLIDENNQLFEHAPALKSAPVLGLDTEFVRERTWHPQPGLLQFSDGRSVWLLDPVRLDRDALADVLHTVLTHRGTVKILHSVGEDLEVLDLTGGALPDPLFDTQRAAALLGYPVQLRYEVLAAELTGDELPGGLGRNNWLRRPLPQPWLDYAADDVRALPAMRQLLTERLEQAGRLDWLVEDCARMLDRWQQPTDTLERIRGASSLDDDSLERLARLARWRDDLAQQRDLPRGFVVPDPALLDAAQVDPKEPGLKRRLADIERLPRRRADDVAEIVQASPEAFERPGTLAPLIPEQRRLIKQLQSRVRVAGEELSLEPTLIASKRDLTRGVQGGPCDWLDGWRGEVLGPTFRAQLSGVG